MGDFFEVLNFLQLLSTTTLNYQLMVERYPNLKEEVDFKISSLLDGKLVRWSTAFYALALAYQLSI